jgi:NAD(P)-dependent dehydrogenase (short-subunit alcohol dehydrogenase family)
MWLACRNTAAGEKLIQEIKESDITTGHAKVYKFDNASFKSIKNFVQEIKRDYDKIHVLINNGMCKKKQSHLYDARKT